MSVEATGNPERDSLQLALALQKLLPITSPWHRQGLERALRVLIRESDNALNDGDHGAMEHQTIARIVRALREASLESNELEAKIAQLDRRTRRRETLLHESISLNDLASIHEAPNGRAWILEHLGEGRLFIVVTDDGGVRIPLALLDEDLNPMPRMSEVIPLLSPLNAWAKWVWLETTSGWINDERTPAQLAKAGEWDLLIDAAARLSQQKVSDQ